MAKKKMSAVFINMRVYFIVFIFIWTVLIVSLLIWGIYKEKNSYKTTVMNVAKSHLEKDHAFRFWQVSHGDVYVLTDKETPSDSQSGSITEHNTIIRSGKKFSLITYQYILQQINDNFDELYDIGSRTISLDPLYLQSMPNSWETNALRLFAKGEEEVSGFTTIGGKPYLQMMRPIIAKKHCEICGYKEGDILGGRSILLPLKNFIAESNKRITNLVIIFVVIWILVIFGMYIGYFRLRKEAKEHWLSVDKLVYREQELEEAQHIAHIGSIIYISVPEEKFYCSNELFNIFGIERQDVSPEFFISNVHPDDRDKFKEILKERQSNNNKVFENEFRIIRKTGEVRFIYQKGRKEFDEKGELLKIHCTMQDITERKQAEMALQESKENFRITLNSIGDAVIATDREGLVTRMNPIAEQLTGWSLDDAKNKPLLEIFRIVNSETKAVVENPVNKVIENGVIVGMGNHTLLIAKDGTEYQIADSGAPIRNINDNIIGVVMVFRDITKEYRIQEELMKSEERLKEAQRIAQIGSWELNLITNTFYWSDEVYRIFDLEPQQLGATYETFLDNIHPDDREFVNNAYTKSLENKTPYNIIHRLLLKDGTEKFVNEHCETFYDDTDKAICSIGTVQDITERKQVEESLLRLSTAIEQADEGVIITDAVGNIQYVNPAYEKTTGFTRADVIGQNAQMFGNESPNIEFFEEVGETLAQKGEWKGHFTSKKKDGTLFEENATISPVLDEQGEIINYVAVMRDVTNEMEMAEHLRQAQKMEAIGTLAGGIAHDFNNILSVIIGYTQLAKMDIDDKNKLINNLDQILRSSKRATDLVKQILTFSRQSKHKLSPVQVSLIIDEVYRLMRATLPATIKIEKKIIAGHILVFGDPIEIHQILMNLCTNAYHAMQDKGGILEIALEELEINENSDIKLQQLEHGKYLQIQVADTGCGITPDVIKQIFDPYFTTKKEGMGTGLGLAVIHGIVEKLNGAITVDSELGKGSKFNVYLPTIVEEKTVIANNDEEDIRGGNERILYVEDEVVLAIMETKSLEFLGYKVTSRTSSIEALEAFRANPENFDLVITDLSMPNMDGIKLAKELLKIRPNIPIILCTGFSDGLTQKKAEVLALKAVLLKPVVSAQMDKAIRKIFD